MIRIKVDSMTCKINLAVKKTNTSFLQVYEMSTCKYLTATHANDDVETLAQKSICNMKKKHANI